MRKQKCPCDYQPSYGSSVYIKQLDSHRTWCIRWQPFLYFNFTLIVILLSGVLLDFLVFVGLASVILLGTTLHSSCLFWISLLFFKAECLATLVLLLFPITASLSGYEFENRLLEIFVASKQIVAIHTHEWKEVQIAGQCINSKKKCIWTMLCCDDYQGVWPFASQINQV